MIGRERALPISRSEVRKLDAGARFSIDRQKLKKRRPPENEFLPLVWRPNAQRANEIRQ